MRRDWGATLPRLLRDFLLQAGGKYIATAFQVIRGVVLAGLLGPLGMGTVATVAVVLGYAMYSDLGVGDAAMRELPLALGAGDQAGVRRWRWYGIAGKISGGLVMAAGLAVYLVITWGDLAPDLRFGLATAIVVIVLQQFVSGQQVVLLAQRRFAASAALTILVPGASLALGLAGAWVAGIRGVFVGQLVAYAVSAAVAGAIGGLPSRTRAERLAMGRLLRVGLPFVALSFAFYNLVYVDQVMVMTLLGRELLGMYTLALYAGTAVYMVPTALAVSVGPRLLLRYGDDPRPETISDLTWRPVEALSIVLPPLIGCAWLAAPAFIAWVLPEYVPAIGPLRIYTAAIFFLGINLGVSTTLFAFGRHAWNIPVIAFSVGFNVVADILLTGLAGLGLSGIALGSLSTYFVYWILQTTLVTRSYGDTWRGGVARLARYGWPGAILVALLSGAWGMGILASTAVLPFAGVLAGLCVLSAARVWRRGGLPALRRAFVREER